MSDRCPGCGRLWAGSPDAALDRGGRFQPQRGLESPFSVISRLGDLGTSWHMSHSHCCSRWIQFQPWKHLYLTSEEVPLKEVPPTMEEHILPSPHFDQCAHWVVWLEQQQVACFQRQMEEEVRIGLVSSHNVNFWNERIVCSHLYCFLILAQLYIRLIYVELNNTGHIEYRFLSNINSFHNRNEAYKLNVVWFPEILKYNCQFTKI